MLPNLKVVNSYMVVLDMSLDWLINGCGKYKVTDLS